MEGGTWRSLHVDTMLIRIKKSKKTIFCDTNTVILLTVVIIIDVIDII